jgi:hypothetical protein
VRRLTVLLLLIALAACTPQDEEAEGASFTLEGTIDGVDPGAEAPEDVNVSVVVGDDPEIGGNRDDEGRSEEPGSLTIGGPSELSGVPEECVEDDYTVFFTEDTRFTPPGVVNEDDFPESLVDRSANITGGYSAANDGPCTFVASSVAVEGDTDDGTVATFTPGPRPDQSPGAGSPGPAVSGEPTSTDDAGATPSS